MDAWRGIVAVVGGAVSALFWAVTLAIYQPFMQPSGGWTDPQTGAQYPNEGSNNTYWPRDVRQFAILLAFAAIVVLVDANLRAVLIAAAGTALWLAADLVLDRLDVHGWGAATGLAVAGVLLAGLLSLAARRLSTGAPGGQLTRHLTATVIAVSGAVLLLVSTPWDEPVTDPAQVRVENALTLMQIVLAVVCTAVAAALLHPATHWRRVAVFGAVAALAAWPATAAIGSGSLFGLVALPVSAALAVAAARPVTLPRLLAAGAAAAALIFPSFLAVYFTGITIGAAMTSAAGNPPINGADEDLSLAYAALGLGLILAALTRWITGPKFAPRFSPASAAEVPAPAR
ncbi:hypothetical protein [Dactylosporangium darangshiense]|uniref:Integral membrane protein n=1 Tax=Dactylosporangium darangshiense TaxID=579108 RepID=A0ABP8DVM1_9ACTN